MNSSGVTVDTSALRAVIPKYEAATGHDLAYVINRAGRNVAFRALEHTPRADKAQIESSLQQVHAHQIRGVNTPTGKLGRRLKKPRPILFPTNLAVTLLVARLKKKGKPIPSRMTLSYQALAMVAARLRSVSFLKSGWLEGIRLFSEAAEMGKGGVKEVKAYGQKKGHAIVAVPANEVSALLDNSAYGKGRPVVGKSRNAQASLLQYAGPALQQAITETAADMKAYAEKRVEQTVRKYWG